MGKKAAQQKAARPMDVVERRKVMVYRDDSIGELGAWVVDVAGEVAKIFDSKLEAKKAANERRRALRREAGLI